MLKKLVLGLLTLSILAASAKNFSTEKAKVDPNVQIQKTNAANLRFDGFGLANGLGDGLRPIGGGSFPGIGDLDIPQVALANTFTITIPYSNPTYMSDDGEVLSNVRVDRKTRKFTVKVNNTVGVHEFYAVINGERQCIKRVFSYLYNRVAYISEVSKEDAFYKAIELDLNNGVITNEQVENLYADFLLLSSPNSNQHDTGFVPTGVLPPYYAHQPNIQKARFYSHVEWQDRNGNWSPLSMCLAKLFINGTFVKSSNLDENGQVFFTLDSSSEYWSKTCEVQIRVYTHSDTFSYGHGYPTHPEQGYNEYYMAVSSKTTSVIDNSTDLSMPISRTYSQFEETSAALSIAQAFATCEMFAKQNVRGFNNHANLQLFHLNVGGGYYGNGFSLYGTSTIYSYDACDRWMLPFRLYGLFFEGVTCMLDSNTDMGFDDDYDNFLYNEDSLYGIEMRAKIVWHRALADMFAVLAYLTMEDEIGNLAPTQSIRDYIDSVENYVPDNTSGDGSIMCTAAYLYKFYTGYVAKNGKTVAGITDVADYFDFAFDNVANTFKDFVNIKFPTQHAFENDKHNSLLEDLFIAPSNIKLVNEINSNTLPVLEWKAGGCASHPNEVFDLWFYGGELPDCHYKNIKKNKYTVNNGIVRYTLTSEQKNALMNIMNNNDNFCYIAVSGYNETDGYKTGPYYSMFTKIVNPDIIDEQTVFEKEIDYSSHFAGRSSGHYVFSCPTYVKFRHSSNVMFFTRGDVNSEIKVRTLNGMELTNDDNSGYANNAFVTYNVTAGEIYEVVVRTLADSRGFQGWSQLDIVQSVNSYDNNYQITHPTAYEDIKRVEYDMYYWLRPGYEFDENDIHKDDFKHDFSVEIGSTAAMIFEPEYGGGFHIALDYTANITLIAMSMGQTTPWNYDCYSGSSYHEIGYLENYINIMEDDACMILVARENKNAPFGPTGRDRHFYLELGCTYMDGEW